MTAILHKPLCRQTDLIDHVSGQPWVITLAEGGRMIHLRPKGARNGLCIPLREVIVHAGRIASIDVLARRAARRGKKGGAA